MAKTANDIAQEAMGRLMMQIILLQADNEQLREDLNKLKEENDALKKEKEDSKNAPK